MGKLNKSLGVGRTQTITVKGRKITFKRIAKTGFRQWQIVGNKKGR